MHRIFVSPGQIRGARVDLAADTVNHLKVLRVRMGEVVAVVARDPDAAPPLIPDHRGTPTDGIGLSPEEYLVRIEVLGRQRGWGQIIERRVNGSEPLAAVHLIQGIAKGDRMDYAVQKCAELGVQSIMPAVTRRTVVRLDGSGAAARRGRWQRIAEEAAAVAGRPRVPYIWPAVSWQAALDRIPPPGSGGTRLIPWEEEGSLGIGDVLDGGAPGPYFLAVGPEGGFPREEVDEAMDRGFMPVSLGPRLLRAETAGAAALTMILYHTGDLGRKPGREPVL